MLGTGRSGVNENDTTMDTATPKFTDFVNFRRLHPAGSEGVHRRSANCSICQRKMSLTSEARCIGASSACSAEQESARELLRHFCGYRVERTCSGWSCTCCYQRLFMAQFCNYCGPAGGSPTLNLTFPPLETSAICRCKSPRNDTCTGRRRRRCRGHLRFQQKQRAF
jgi:hypothetical protein